MLTLRHLHFDRCDRMGGQHDTTRKGTEGVVSMMAHLILAFLSGSFMLLDPFGKGCQLICYVNQ